MRIKILVGFVVALVVVLMSGLFNGTVVQAEDVCPVQVYGQSFTPTSTDEIEVFNALLPSIDDFHTIQFDADFMMYNASTHTVKYTFRVYIDIDLVAEYSRAYAHTNYLVGLAPGPLHMDVRATKKYFVVTKIDGADLSYEYAIEHEFVDSLWGVAHNTQSFTAGKPFRVTIAPNRVEDGVVFARMAATLHCQN